jgi:hypothetical protein
VDELFVSVSAPHELLLILKYLQSKLKKKKTSYRYFCTTRDTVGHFMQILDEARHPDNRLMASLQAPITKNQTYNSKPEFNFDHLMSAVS